jgi:pseudouridine-5'-phosphate glycosidase
MTAAKILRMVGVFFLYSISRSRLFAYIDTQWQLDMNNGALIAVPIPMEYEKIGMTIQKAVDQAVAEAEENGVSKRGKEATPWLLARVNELTKGDSLESNIALLKNTALVGECICAYRRFKFYGLVQAER